jgi:hypothetical protein
LTFIPLAVTAPDLIQVFPLTSDFGWLILNPNFTIHIAVKQAIASKGRSLRGTDTGRTPTDIPGREGSF